ncbi:Ankyrin Repeat Protein [Seminavis robusta]|uniref:Ankyrin Repeat Protein n=1 Tax=Seminavis robusta TaxID=568900 RepID=A0A9N8HSA0_9STRA|nr:Ankyrin Repeat Protein [Seminavis robusta]|eukprot:Sro1690_g291370.1 Ankyrin Repeat Protein (485) ;mRNA; f:13737-15283
MATAAAVKELQLPEASHVDLLSATTTRRKRKRVSVIADPYARLAAANNNHGPSADSSGTAKSGRGTEAGWTHCPMCFPLSKKVFARGRGIASHLHSVHTPWKAPSKAERKRRRKLQEQKQRQQNGVIEGAVVEVQQQQHPESWDPTDKDVEEWNSKVLEMVQSLEEQPLLSSNNKHKNSSAAKQQQSSQTSGVDRNGQVAKSYKASLPPFLQAAADGNLDTLTAMLGNNTKDKIMALLNQTDRHGSIAEHWAAGGGHLDCLKLLKETRRQQQQLATDNNKDNHDATTATATHGDAENGPKLRRRDGKTSLHYAARNGQVKCIEYLLQNGHAVDEVSGDGTTPFHLACFGAHTHAMELLVNQYGACPGKPNEWGCTAAHWVAMTKCESTEQVKQACQLLSTTFGVSFATRQSQGHSPLHKAAQRQNRCVIEWLAMSQTDGGAGLLFSERRFAGQPDEGGYTPSDIWNSVGGDRLFGEWMKNEMGW